MISQIPPNLPDNPSRYCTRARLEELVGSIESIHFSIPDDAPAWLVEEAEQITPGDLTPALVAGCMHDRHIDTDMPPLRQGFCYAALTVLLQRVKARKPHVVDCRKCGSSEQFEAYLLSILDFDPRLVWSGGEPSELNTVRFVIEG